MNTIEVKTVTQETLAEADKGSWYTIAGCGGSLKDWIDGYQEIFDDQGIGTPVAWYTATGAQVNEYVDPVNWRDAFQSDRRFLFIPLDGLAIGKLAMVKLAMSDRWFDDIVANARR